MDRWIRVAASAALLITVTGCAVAPLDRAADAAGERIAARIGAGPEWQPGLDITVAAPEIREPLNLPVALALAFTRNPEIRRQYARLGLAHADLQDAARIANPTLSLAWLNPGGGGRDQTTRGISASFADLLLLPARRRLSAAEFQRVELAVGSELVALAHKVETSWYAHVGALQIAAMRDAVAVAAENESALAQRFHEAGNISRLELDLQQGAAARARIQALRSRSDVASTRAQLAGLLGLRAEAEWQTVERLPVPPDAPPAREALMQRALTQRLDLSAARREVAMLADALGVTGRWRLLGSADAGYKHEHEPDDSRLSGPTLDLELPIFNQGQGAVARARARLLDARAREQALTLSVENEVTAGLERLVVARGVTESYRNELLPSTASAVARQQERVNFMLVSVFELIRSRREEYDAWQGYFESVRDYWIARSALRAAIGGLLPGDEALPPATVGAEEVVMPGAEPDRRDEQHEHGGERP